MVACFSFIESNITIFFKQFERLVKVIRFRKDFISAFLQQRRLKPFSYLLCPDNFKSFFCPQNFIIYATNTESMYCLFLVVVSNINRIAKCVYINKDILRTLTFNSTFYTMDNATKAKYLTMIFTAPVLAVYKLCELNFLNIIVIVIGEILLCCFIKF